MGISSLQMIAWKLELTLRAFEKLLIGILRSGGGMVGMV